MPQPDPYDRLTRFTGSEAGKATAQLGVNLDKEFDEANLTVRQVLANLALIQRDDGKLANKSVHPEALDDATLLIVDTGGFRMNGTWSVGKVLTAGDIVNSGGSLYIVVANHTAVDLSADKVAGRLAGPILDPSQANGVLSQFAASNGSSLVGFSQIGIGAIARTVQDKLRDAISAFDFMTAAQIADVQNGTLLLDVTAALNAALTVAMALKKTLFLPAGIYGVTDSGSFGYALLNRGASMIGEGTFYSQIVPLTSMPAGSDILRIEPNPGAYIDFLNLSRFSIQPANAGTKYGKRGVYMYFNAATNLAKFHMSDCYFLGGNDYGFEMYNNTAVNIQGVPAHSTIERNFFVEGMKLVGVGDSLNIQENLFRATGGSRPAIWLDIANVDGTAMAPSIQRNNADCVGGFLYMVRGRCPKIRDNNIELSAGPGTANGAVIDIHGSGGNIPYASIVDNHIGIFGTATATSAIRIATATGTQVDRNTILTGLTTTNGVLITSAASDTQIGRNEFHPNFVNAINDSGVGTMGVPVAVTPKNSWTNSGGGYQTLAAFKDDNGWVRVVGVINAPGSPSGTIFATLPASLRPPTSLPRIVVDATVSGAVSTGSVEISTAGDMTFYGSNSTTRIGISFSFPTTAYLAGTL